MLGPINHTINHGHTVGWKYTKSIRVVVVSYLHRSYDLYDPLSDIISKSKAACLLYVYIYIYR